MGWLSQLLRTDVTGRSAPLRCKVQKDEHFSPCGQRIQSLSVLFLYVVRTIQMREKLQ
jgi:hypothetical protein